MGEGPTYRERQKGRVSYRECGEEMAAGSLAIHLMTQHGQVAEAQRIWRTQAVGDGPQKFRMAFPDKGGPRSFPAEECPDQAATRKVMQVHFLNEHILDTVVILEEGKLTHPRCTRCDILLPRRALNDRHLTKAQCARGAERKRRRLAEADLREISERSFEAYGEPLENVTTFQYLGQVLTAEDYDCLAVVDNLGKARNSWGRLSWILSREGADPKVLGNFYKAVAQAVFLFSAETWVLIPRMERALDSFQHRVARRITRRQPRRQRYGSCEYPPLAEVMGEAGFEGIRKSVTRRQKTVAQYIATQPIMELCKRATPRPGARVSWRWWEQTGIDLEEAKKRAAEAATDPESELDSELNADPGGEEEPRGASGSSGTEWSGAEE